MVISGGLNSLQVDEVNIENYSPSSRQTLFVASKLVAACSTLVLTSKYAITLQFYKHHSVLCWTKQSSSGPS